MEYHLLRLPLVSPDGIWMFLAEEATTAGIHEVNPQALPASVLRDHTTTHARRGDTVAMLMARTHNLITSSIIVITRTIVHISINIILHIISIIISNKSPASRVVL